VSRYLKIAVTCAVMLAVALPALALENKINGYFRIQGISGNGYNNITGYVKPVAGKAGKPNGEKDQAATNFVDQRLRVKWTANVDENSGFVYFAEVDTPWGNGSGGQGTRGTGGAVGADAVNMETKNAYLFFKAYDFSVNAGVQGLSGGCDYAFLLQDAAALKVSKKFGSLSTTFIWSKFQENGANAVPNATYADKQYAVDKDVDLYGVMVAPMLGDAKLNIGLFMISNQANGAEQYTMSAEFNSKVGGMDLKAWAIAQLGDRVATGAAGHDALAASVKVSGGFGAVRMIVYGDSDGFEDQSDQYELPDTGLSIFMTDKFHNNGGQGARALYDAAYAGNGLFSLIYTGKQNIDKFYVDYAAGYFMSLDDAATKTMTPGGTNLGFEVSAGVGTKITEKVDLSLRGSYALLGDYYDGTANGSDPEDPYKVVAMLNMGF